MTIKTLLNEAARKSNKGPTPTCVNDKTFDPKVRIETGSAT